ncbi:hypothetical protein DL93DRAFT_38742 [Clavulina sp. PMI_390]|nr:hypothetical protein DL93DRAFT_38742 [Clavulina sp. PMI_390]
MLRVKPRFFRSRTKPKPPNQSTKDLFSSLPTEILLLIVDALDVDPYYKPNPLLSLSCLSQRLNDFTNSFLWRHFIICPPAGVAIERNSALEIVQARANALLRCPQRALYLQHLTLEPTFTSATLMRAIRRVFSAIPNLKKLDIHISQTSDQASRTSQSLAHALETLTYPLPFQLEELECEASLFTSPPGIYRFLLDQSSIRRLSIRRIGDESPFWTAPLPTTLKAEHGIFDERSVCLLPSIEEFCGPASYSSLVLHGVQRPLKSISLYTPSTVVDLDGSRALHFPTHHTKTQREIPSGACCTEVSYPTPALLARTDTLSLWTDGPSDAHDILPSPYLPMRKWDREAGQHVDRIEFAPLLPFLLIWGYGIAPSSLRFLRLARSKRPTDVEEHMSQFPLSILCELTALEELEWLMFDDWARRDEYSGVLAMPTVHEAARAFLEGVAREAASKRLWRIAFLAFKKRYLELVRIQVCDGVEVMAGWEELEDLTKTVQLWLGDGAHWTMRVRTDVMAQAEFYRLRPTRPRQVVTW